MRFLTIAFTLAATFWSFAFAQAAPIRACEELFGLKSPTQIVVQPPALHENLVLIHPSLAAQTARAKSLVEKLIAGLRGNDYEVSVALPALVNAAITAPINEAARHLDFFNRGESQVTLDTEINQILIASGQGVKARRQITRKDGNFISAPLLDHEVSDLLETLKICAEHAAVCTTRASLKTKVITDHVAALITMRFQLLADFDFLTEVLNGLSSRHLSEKDFEKIFYELDQKQQRLRTLADRIEKQVGQIRAQLETASHTIETTALNGLLLQDAQAQLTNTNIRLTTETLTEIEILERAHEEPLTIDQLKTIEYFKRQPYRQMTAKQWLAQTKALRSIRHWRAVNEVIRLLPSLQNAAERQLLQRALMDLSYDSRLDDMIIEVGRQRILVNQIIYEGLINRVGDTSSNSIALRMATAPGTNATYLENRMYTDEDLPLLAAFAQHKGLYAGTYFKWKMSPATLLISKVISEKSIELLSLLVKTPSRQWDQTQVDAQYQVLLLEMKKSLREHGPQSLKVPLGTTLAQQIAEEARTNPPR